MPAPRLRMLGILAPAKPMLNMNLERAPDEEVKDIGARIG
ncbi:hypothetical protein CBM2634_A100130 [Cupriavidus taiwanensis]|uniref:Uncharacterized protein n=2 Tax=Cupriavidus taiwanensis TaxID=164546 RepID=A0A375IVT6_9BURK|nr:hypothetical protein CBM2634_A100130 [Cupriavidus taiwanensis]